MSTNAAKFKRGMTIPLVLVFGAVFLMMMAGLFGFVLTQHRLSLRKAAYELSLNIAEAGMNYYKWCLNHGIEATCLGEKVFSDASANVIGKFHLESESASSCGEIIQRRITSSGWTNEFPDIKRKIRSLYARASIAKYSYFLNDNVWIGDDHEIRGPYQSNGGIRMDGENQSTISSSKEEWICTSSFGCSTCPTSKGCRIQSSQCYCPGVFTTTDNSEPDLFEFPVPPFDFGSITTDLAQMKASAQASGVYLPPSKNINPSAKGYRIKFINNGTFEAWIITNLSSTYAYSLEESWHYDYFTISSEYLYNTYTIPSSCSAVFIEDNIWPEGEIRGKVAVASANLIDANNDADIVLAGNIDYAIKDGTDGLVLIGERNILIGPQSPNQMELRGVFIAQKGRFSRNHYPGNFREKLEIYGSVVSNGRVGTQWTSGSYTVSGYQKRESYFDSSLVYNPPVFTPFIDQNFKIFNWEEIK